MDLDLGRRSIVGWAETAPLDAGAEFTPAKEKFVVEMPIGEGGMGEVFLVTGRDLMRQVGMKVLKRGPDGKWRILPILVEGKAREFCVERYGEGFEWRIPVLAISWDDAVAYCAWKTRTTGKEWRLPTEEEREKAARGVDGRRFAWGDLEDASLGHCRESRAHGSQPEPVGAFPTSESVHGMGDASGGMWDWTDP